MKLESVKTPSPQAGRGSLRDGILYALVFLLPLKFTGIIILNQWPQGLDDWWLGGWPIELAVVALVGWIVAAGAAAIRHRHGFSKGLHLKWPLWLILAFVAAQWIAAQGSLWPHRAFPVCIYLTATAACFLIGWMPRDDKRYQGCLGALAAAAFIVCVLALQQHFGGFARDLAYAKEHLSGVGGIPSSELPAIIDKLKQGRVFGSFPGSPNSLAGFLILVTAPACYWLWRYFSEKHGRFAGAIMCGLLGVFSIYSLALTKSRGALIAAAAALAAGACVYPRLSVRVRAVVVGVVVVAGVGVCMLAGAKRGSSSMEARTDYWRAAVTMIAESPWLGGGPGTFGLRYVEHRQEGAEWTRLAHNSFLQMWTDSGVVGFASFTLLWLAILWQGARRLLKESFNPLLWFSWIGLIAWTVHNLLDFDLFIAAIAWPAFLMGGWFFRQIDRSSGTALS